ncbi:antigen 5 like allergen Cul n 1 isoform X2 [Zeugodacus cucurbitae]|uniref:Venom allergen 3 n=2 Tax=Zeugodacus cucurbitae TaxID=28588 RepID=A0A0A1XPY7_ZEUCU|nr:antigen 5 like allergen Cul n 1 isoform X2 [Zeugodacus cucurbitae]XP_054085180.1 antigen 5 like allergen Cul n 1 isoform X2 [Zeugodacus cucurbitae]
MFRLYFLALGIIAFAAAEHLFCTLTCLNEGAQHGACVNPHGRLGGDCPKTTKLLNMNKNKNGYKKFLLDKHNKLRNSIASGQVANLATANKMGEMFWDRQLGFLSVFSAKRCSLSDDYCYRTGLLPNPGRVAKIFEFSNTSEVNPTNVKLKIDEWFNELNETAKEIKTIFPPHEDKVLNIAHILEEENNRIGCAMSHWRKKADNVTKLILVCLYATDVKSNLPLYSMGPPASRCRTTESILYSSLCSINEEYDYSEGLPQFINSQAKVTINIASSTRV